MPRTRKTPTMESPEAYDAEIIANATRYEASIFVGRKASSTGYLGAEADTREGIDAAIADWKAQFPTRQAMLYAIDGDGNKALIPTGGPTPADLKAAKAKADKPAKAPKPAKGGKKGRNWKAPRLKAETPAAAEAEAAPEKIGRARKAAKAKPATEPRAPLAHSARPTSKYREMQERAEAGIMPPAPDFSAPSFTPPYHKRLAALQALIDAGDLAAIEAHEIKTYDSAMLALDRYRNMALTALRAQAAQALEAPDHQAAKIAAKAKGGRRRKAEGAGAAA